MITKSPWHYSPHYGEWSVWSEPCKKNPRSECLPYVAMVTHEADAQLIAAAPDLLEICKDLANEKALPGAIRKRIKEVLRKACGEQ